ncbi:MAG: hypothetical protein KA325_01335 [Flavobacterium sp.]|nr:hypothetical protein [Flavobacterium sp.]
MNQEEKEYFERLSAQFVKEISLPNEFGIFVENSDLKGKYIESAVRVFINKIIYSGKISTGGVISPESPIAKNQFDIIIWKPNPFPAIFEFENFAIVPRRSVFGLIEIKSSNYSGAIVKIKENVAKYSDFTKEGLTNKKGIGIICLNKGKQKPNDDFFILFSEKDDGSIKPNSIGIISFIQYLMRIEYDLMRIDLINEPSDELLNSLD